jgi:chromosomal replication initiator protein
MNRLPQALPGLLPTLASRLSAGLVVQLAPPGALARREIVRQTAGQLGLTFSDETVGQLAGAIAARSGLATVPRLRHAVMQLAANTRAESEPLRSSQVARLLEEEAPESKAVVRQAISAVGRHFDIPIRELKGKSRQQSIADARGIAMYLARELTGESYAEIGNCFGGRDHSTVLHNCRKVRNSVSSDETSRRLVEDLAAQVAGACT